MEIYSILVRLRTNLDERDHSCSGMIRRGEQEEISFVRTQTMVIIKHYYNPSRNGAALKLNK